MKRIILAIIALAATAGIAWGVGAMVVQVAATRWLQDRAAEGWVADATDLGVSGFPVQFITEFIEIELADPQTGLAWAAPVFRLEQDVLRLDRISARFPEPFTIATSGEQITIADLGLGGLDMEATLDVQPMARFALDALAVDTGPVLITSDAGWQTQWEQGSLVVSRAEERESTYNGVFSAITMALPEIWRARLDPDGLLPTAFDQAEVRATGTFTAPWDIDAIERARPQITRLEIEVVRAQWGQMSFHASGTLDVDSGGIPTGELALRAENWRSMVDLAVNAGVLTERMRPATEGVLGVLAGMNGTEEDIDTTLTFSDGRAFIGPLPVGPAPNLRFRQRQ